MQMQYTKKRWRTWFILLSLAVMAVLASGCASSGNSDTGEAPLTEELALSTESKSEAERAAPAEGDNFNYSADSTEGGGTTGGSSGGDLADIALSSAQGAFNQKLIYKANLTMEVAQYDKAISELRNAIHQSGGYILQFQDGQYENEKGSTYTIKVPSTAFMSFIDHLDGIEHTHFERQLGATDVTEEYVDLESRLKAKQVVEERLLGFMDKAERADDLVKFSQQLAGVQEEIEQIKGRIRYLDRNVTFSTVELRIYQPSEAAALGKEDKNLGQRMASALEGSLHAVSVALQAILVFVIGALPVLALLAVIGIPVYWLLKRRAVKPQSGSGHSKITDTIEESDDN